MADMYLLVPRSPTLLRLGATAIRTRPQSAYVDSAVAVIIGGVRHADTLAREDHQSVRPRDSELGLGGDCPIDMRTGTSWIRSTASSRVRWPPSPTHSSE